MCSKASYGGEERHLILELFPCLQDFCHDVNKVLAMVAYDYLASVMAGVTTSRRGVEALNPRSEGEPHYHSSRQGMCNSATSRL
jgi:hypothetical protein